jgi:hypothetical protein
MKMKGVRSGNKSGCHDRKAYAHGGRVMAYANGGVVGDEADAFMNDAADQANMVDGVPVRQRLDRRMPKSGKSTSITINVGAPKAEVETPKVPPVVPPGIPPMAGAPPMPPPMMPPAGGPPPGMPMRANGGRVGKADGGLVEGINRAARKMTRHSQVPGHGSTANAGGFTAGKAEGSFQRSHPGKGLIVEKDDGSMGINMPKYVPGSAKETKGKPGTQSGTMRKNGGRVDMDAGAGGGLGRLEKIKDYGKNAGRPARANGGSVQASAADTDEARRGRGNMFSADDQIKVPTSDAVSDAMANMGNHRRQNVAPSMGRKNGGKVGK